MSKFPGAKPPTPVIYKTPETGAMKPPGEIEDLNLNPFNSRGRLNEIGFFGTLLVNAFVMLAAAALIHIPLERARGDGNLANILRLSGIWFFIFSCGFWVASSAFLKRWREILNDSSPSWWLKLGIRISLLSPLLSIWLTVMTSLFTRWGPLEARLDRKRSLTLVLISFMIFHAGFLFWSSAVGDLQVNGFHLIRRGAAAPLESLERGLAPGFPKPVVPNNRFYIHVFPYLNPTTKTLVSIWTDLQRVRTIFRDTTDRPQTVCREKLAYLRVIVDDCFFYRFRKTGELSPFSLPIFAMLADFRYRERNNPSSLALAKSEAAIEVMNYIAPLAKAPVAETVQNEKSPFEMTVPAILALNNVLMVFEASPIVLPRIRFLSPLGLLTAFGSPEVALLTLTDDVRKIILLRQVMPMLEMQLKQLRSMTTMVTKFEPTEVAERYTAEINDLTERIESLHRDPLQMHVSAH